MIGKKIFDAARKWKVLRGDLVEIMAGKDKGKQGTIKKVLREDETVIVDGCNLVKKHVKGTKEQPGGIVTKEAAIHVSNVAVIDPATKEPVRIAFRFLEDGTKVRVAKSTGNVIPRPSILTKRVWERPTAPGPKDTPIDIAQKNTLTQ